LNPAGSDQLKIDALGIFDNANLPPETSENEC